MNKFFERVLFGTAISVVSFASLLAGTPAEGAIIAGDIRSEPLNEFDERKVEGHFEFDDSKINGFGRELLTTNDGLLLDLSFVSGNALHDGVSYTAEPVAEFVDGKFLGLGLVAEVPDGEVSILSTPEGSLLEWRSHENEFHELSEIRYSLAEPDKMLIGAFIGLGSAVILAGSFKKEIQSFLSNDAAVKLV